MHHRDRFVYLTILLAVFGLISVYSASQSVAEVDYGDPMFYFRRQAIWGGIALAVGFVASRMQAAEWTRYCAHLYLLSLLLLPMVWLPVIGVEVNGAARWIDIGLMNFQPSELARLALLLFSARLALLLRERKRARPWWLILGLTLLLAAPPAALILKQPDLGYAMLLIVGAMVPLVVAGLPWGYILTGLAAGVTGVSYIILRTSWRAERIAAWLDPFAHAQQGGFQTVQGLLAISSGGLMGSGLGEGRVKLFYLPEAHTDFIFAVIAEEWGLLGSASLVVLFLWWGYEGLMLARQAKNDYFRVTAASIVIAILIQAYLNIAVITNLLPVTGLPLPLISYGGSHLLFVGLQVGLILSLTRAKPTKEATPR